MLRTPAVLSGSPKDIADTIRGYRDNYGVTYITVQQHTVRPSPRSSRNCGNAQSQR